jgi:scyllo-inositol 2-dehydrogenase (NADP+)
MVVKVANDLLTSSLLPTAPPKRPAKLRNALRVGLCGIGRSGAGMVARDLAVLPQIKVVAGFDLIEDRARQLSALCGSKAYTTFDAMLDDPDIELVIVATRSHEHVPMTIKALRAGRDVLVEKPMALDVACADKLIAAAKASGRRLFVRHNRRFDAPFLQAKEIIASGKLGKLFAVQLRQGKYQRRADWQTLKKFGGGQLLNWGPHLVDWALQLIGGTAVDVWADLKLIAAAGDAEDYVKLLLRGPTGITADIEINGAAALDQAPWLIMGSQGSLQIDANNQCKLRYFNARKLSRVKADLSTPTSRAGAHFAGGDGIPWIEEEFPAAPKRKINFWVELYKSIRRGTPFPVTLDQARETMRVISLAKK